MSPAKTGAKEGRDKAGRFKPGCSGNPKGKRPGTRNAATMAAQKLLDGEAEALTRRAVEVALRGDTGALRLCIERILPARKDTPVEVDLPPIKGAQDAVKALSALLAAVGRGELTPSEAQSVAGLLESFRRALELGDLEERLTAIEEQLKL